MRVGAPKGGRVHWFLFQLHKDIKKHYQIDYVYTNHSYLLYRMQGRFIYDLFTIIRTSKKCFRVSYVCKSQRLFFYQSFKTSNEASYYVYRIYRLVESSAV